MKNECGERKYEFTECGLYLATILSTHDHKICVHYLSRSRKVQHYYLYLTTTSLKRLNILFL